MTTTKKQIDTVAIRVYEACSESVIETLIALLANDEHSRALRAALLTLTSSDSDPTLAIVPASEQPFDPGEARAAASNITAEGRS